ncbi:ribosomal maturation YjgA family protein [Alkaliphilus transvaalensis]|uniref:ribosomal maturation YjgA family protein n=1 Tax=Alkaliphilus transvaalensis TaxID=114628 RepID=UPI00047DE772|nr:DUF2809 domain-containing protein [Alkaliphilus transvaalensis]
MNIKRNRTIYLILIIIVVLLGLVSRTDHFPRWVHLYVGDILWALMIFFIIGLIFKEKSTLWIMISAISFTFFIEFSQLYQATWINNIRHTTLGGLVLGFGFLWSDLFSYSIGILIGSLIEAIILHKRSFIK